MRENSMNPLRCFVVQFAVAFATATLSIGVASAQTAFTSGNLVVLRIADRTALTAQAVQIQEYTTSTTSLGTALQSIVIPSSTETNKFTVVGNLTAAGNLSLNPNSTVTFAGYRASSGDLSPVTASSATVNRVIGSLNLTTGVLNTNVSLSGAYDGLTFRSVATSNGQTFYLSGASGISAAAAGGGQIATVAGGLPSTVTTLSSTTALTTDFNNNLRHIQVANGNLFVSSGSSTPGQQVFQVGTGLPTTGNQTLSASFGTQNATNPYNSFALARLGTGTSWNSTGFDTIYAVKNNSVIGSSVQKWSFDGTAWTAAGNISLSGVNHIAIRQNSAASVDLFVTTQTPTALTLSTIQVLTDTTGFGGSLSGTFNTILSGTGNEGFLGIAYYTPVPEPSTVLAISAAALALVGAVRRRRKGEPVLA